MEYGADVRNFWQIDGADCNVHSPHLHFCRPPRQITAVHISIVGNFDIFSYLPLAYYNSFPPEYQAVREFAYDGNVRMYK